ncbi:MAG: alpha/beta fold hydrolase [Alphaproteobacteria bacterium]|jgi:pimeloyl-ACP methyl ester carboxylesterase|nr:alpha/beta fold hydrolase [Alphaproteobacteria bacterium]MBT4016489.1 alpha/beta fold hydrolase [Alphaproteobacteria bacterium]MBT5158827.1 alpha/beta fold hydrolase [Alphaproteobacteria bacterium]MBT6387405.1 alpha/beta fold hydrolase [Alphaproteobacteria bacterium]
MKPFRIEVPDAVLDDLQARLALTRFPDEATDADWSWGANLGYMKDLVAYWQNGYDWRAAEEKLNAFPQFIAPVSEPVSGEKFDIHFVHVKSQQENATPLLISHGWPGSFYELLGIVEALANPAQHGAPDAPAFDVIVPSLPGYGFSSAPAQPITPKDIARIFNNLMTNTLGYDKYVTQGGDWGSVVTAWMAQLYPEHVAASHFNMLGLRPDLGTGTSPVTAEEGKWIKQLQKRMKSEGGYQAIQGTKPQTLAYGLTDSPVGLAGWITEKFHGWPAADGSQTPPFSMDQLLTNIMIYWVNGNINQANWLYIGLMDGSAASLGPGERVTVPCGFALFPWDLFPPAPQSWIERGYNVVHRTDMKDGGHFAAMEKPAELIADMQKFFGAQL